MLIGSGNPYYCGNWSTRYKTIPVKEIVKINKKDTNVLSSVTLDMQSFVDNIQNDETVPKITPIKRIITKSTMFLSFSDENNKLQPLSGLRILVYILNPYIAPTPFLMVVPNCV